MPPNPYGFGAQLPWPPGFYELNSTLTPLYMNGLPSQNHTFQKATPHQMLPRHRTSKSESESFNGYRNIFFFFDTFGIQVYVNFGFILAHRSHVVLGGQMPMGTLEPETSTESTCTTTSGKPTRTGVLDMDTLRLPRFLRWRHRRRN